MTPSFYIYPGLPVRATGKQRIIDAVCKYYGVSFEQLTEHTRRREIRQPRQMCIYLLRKHTQMTLKAIGEYLGGYDHTTCIFAITAVQNDIDTNEEFRAEAEKIKKMI